MKNRYSVFLIVGVSLFVAIILFIVGPDYNGPSKVFVRSYLIDILLPMNVYLLFQVALRKSFSTKMSRIYGFALTFLIGLTAEILQYLDIDFLGSTYDPVDIAMYLMGTTIGLIIDLLLISKMENHS